MKSPSDRKTNRRAIVILGGIQPTQLAAADVADTINTLSSCFSVSIMTYASAECSEMFPRARIIPLPVIPIRGSFQTFCVECWFVLPFMRGDLIYVAGPEYAPAVMMNIRRPVLCYGNSNPIQHVLNTKRKGGLLSGLLSRINGLGMSIGLRSCDMILAISPQLKEVYTSLGLPASRIREIPLGVQLNDYDPTNKRKPDTGNRVWEGVYHGTVSKERGLEIMVEGARMLASRRQDFRIKLVGCLPGQAKMANELVKKAGMQNHFEIHPPVPHKNIPATLWSADFGISLLEPNEYFATSPPVKVLEFLAAGLPVIANSIPTHSLFLEDGVNALIIPYDAKSFADAMNTIMRDSNLRGRLSGNALKSAQRFSDESTHRVFVDSALELVHG